MALPLPSSSSIDFTDDAIRKAAEGARLPAGWHPFVITSAKAEVSESEKTYGNLVLKIRAAALADTSDVTSKVYPEMFMNVTLPFVNPNVPGHQAPEWAPRICTSFFQAVDDNLPVLTREGSQFMFAGEPVDGLDIAQCKADATKAVFETAKATLADPTALVGNTFYGLVGESKGFWGIQKQARELPPDAECVDLGDLVKPKVAVKGAPAKKGKK